jgi:hypothetical protein
MVKMAVIDMATLVGLDMYANQLENSSCRRLVNSVARNMRRVELNRTCAPFAHADVQHLNCQ